MRWWWADRISYRDGATVGLLISIAHAWLWTISDARHRPKCKVYPKPFRGQTLVGMLKAQTALKLLRSITGLPNHNVAVRVKLLNLSIGKHKFR